MHLYNRQKVRREINLLQLVALILIRNNRTGTSPKRRDRVATSLDRRMVQDRNSNLRKVAHLISSRHLKKVAHHVSSSSQDHHARQGQKVSQGRRDHSAKVLSQNRKANQDPKGNQDLKVSKDRRDRVVTRTETTDLVRRDQGKSANRSHPKRVEEMAVLLRHKTNEEGYGFRSLFQ